MFKRTNFFITSQHCNHHLLSPQSPKEASLTVTNYWRRTGSLIPAPLCEVNTAPLMHSNLAAVCLYSAGLQWVTADAQHVPVTPQMWIIQICVVSNQTASDGAQGNCLLIEAEKRCVCMSVCVSSVASCMNRWLCPYLHETPDDKWVHPSNLV